MFKERLTPSEAPAPVRDQEVGYLRRASAALAVAGVGFIGGFAGGDALPTPVELGPHDATVRVIPDAEIVFDLGAPGMATIGESPMPAGGLYFNIKGMPDGDGTTLTWDDLSKYEQFYTSAGRSAMAIEVQNALVGRGLWGGAYGAGGLILGYSLLGARGRKALREVMGSRRTQVAFGIVSSLTLLTGSVPEPAPFAGQPENAVLASYGIHGVHMEGKELETAVNEFAPRGIGYIRDIDTYYGLGRKNVLAAIKAQQEKERANPSLLYQKLQDGSAVRVGWTSDMHCNINAAKIAAKAAKELGVLFMIDSGDQTMGGSKAERFCVPVMPEVLGSDIPIFESLGNHDDPIETGQADQTYHYRVLKGGILEYKGFKILGDSDVMRNGLGQDYHQAGSETLLQEGQRIADVACGAGGVDIVTMHERDAAQTSAQENCAKLVLDGHTHVLKQEPTTVSPDGTKVTYWMTNGSSGGAAPDKFTLETRLGQDAIDVFLILDAQTHEPLGYQVLSMHTDASASLTDIILFERPTTSGKRPA